jgi:hypothetical protein
MRLYNRAGAMERCGVGSARALPSTPPEMEGHRVLGRGVYQAESRKLNGSVSRDLTLQCHQVFTNANYMRKLQVKSPTAAMPDIAASGLVMNCHARMSGKDLLMLAKGISLSMPQRAII